MLARARQWLGRSLLAAGLFLPASQGDAAPVDNSPAFSRERGFGIPFHPIETLDRQRIDEVQLYWSTDRGRTWRQYANARSDARSFPFSAPRDGEYWFAVRTRDREGRLYPPTLEGVAPGLRVIVDTAPPEATLRLLAPVGGQVGVRWEIFDDFLVAESLRIEYRTRQGSGWSPVNVEPKPAGEAHWSPGAGGPIDIRLRVADRAGNETVKEIGGSAPTGVIGGGPAAAGPIGPQTPISGYPPNAGGAYPAPAGLGSHGVPGGAPGQGMMPPQGGVIARTPAVGGGAMGYPPNPAAAPGYPPGPAAAPGVADSFQIPAQPTMTPMGQPGQQPGVSAAPFNGAPQGFNPANANGPSFPGAVVGAPGGFTPNPTMPTPQWAPPTAQPRVTDVTSAQPVATTSSRPQGLNVKLVNATRFDIQYAADDVGKSGLGAVKLWYTLDGRAWHCYGEDEDKKSPFTVEVAGEGTYGFTLVAQSGAGMGDDPPRDGQPPQMWIEVDMTPPAAQVEPPAVGQGPQAGVVTITWTAQDPNLAPKGIKLLFSDQADGPWTTIADKLENTGKYQWKTPSDVPFRFFVRVEARDRAGNVGRADTLRPVFVDLAKPKLKIIGVEPTGTAPRETDDFPSPPEH